MEPGVQTSRLENGLRVVTHSMPHLETATLGLWVDTGARWELVSENGLSHLLEHMAFKGTTTRSAQDIAEEIEAVGGIINAYTSRENTAYYAQVLRDDVPLALTLLADILQNSVFDDEELNRERDVVIQEIGEAHDIPDDVIFDMMQETAFPDQAIGRSILGTKDRVAAFERADLMRFMGKHYTPSRMVLSAAGAVDHVQLSRIAADVLTSLAPHSAQTHDSLRYEGGACHDGRDLEQLHMMLTLPGVGYDDPDYYALQMLSTIAGGGMSSRLFQEVREKRGLAYSVYSFSNSYTDGGLFGIYAGTSPHQVHDLASVMCDQLTSLTQAVSDIELNRAKAQLKASLMMSMESSSARCEQLARQMLIFGRPIDKQEMMTNLDAVSCENVTNAATRLIHGGRPTLATVGPQSRTYTSADHLLDRVQSYLI